MIIKNLVSLKILENSLIINDDYLNPLLNDSKRHPIINIMIEKNVY
jgi:hypothetical protein